MWEDVHRLHANTQRFTCRTRASVDLGVSGGPGIGPMRILRMQHILGQTLGAGLEPSRLLAVLLTQRTDMFSHEAYMLLRDDHKHCVQVSAVMLLKGKVVGLQGRGVSFTVWTGRASLRVE